MTMHFDESLNTKPLRIRCYLFDEVERLWQHETARSRLLHRVANRVEAHHRDTIVRQCRKDALQVVLSHGMVHVDVELMWGKGHPESYLFTRLQRRFDEGRPRARTIDGGHILAGRSTRKYRALGQE